MSEVQDRINKMKRIDKGLVLVGNNVIFELNTNWDNGKGGDKTRFSALTKEYQAHKVSIGRNPIPNMFVDGTMRQALYPKKVGSNQVDVTFRNSGNPNERAKAEGNQANRPNMMKLSKTFKNKQVKILEKYISGKLA